MIHIGTIIQEELHNQHRSISWLAQMICTDRTNVYRILKKQNLDTELLKRISIALNHDFFQYFSDEMDLKR